MEAVMVFCVKETILRLQFTVGNAMENSPPMGLEPVSHTAEVVEV